MINYNETIQPLIDASLLKQREVYYYQNDALADAFQLFFDFCTENLIRNQEEYQINPSHFYYANDYEINACAYQKNGHGFISVNMGVMVRLWDFYRDHADIFDDGRFEHYQEIADYKNISADFLLFQYTTLYFYYHELGHLIQHNHAQVPFLLYENLSENEDEANSLLSQTLEFDADWYASTQLAFVLTGYYRNEQTENLECTVQELTDLISLGLSAIFNYYILNANRFPQLYYREKSHPHPFVRITYVLTFIMDNISPNLPENFQIDYHTALANAILLSEEFLMNGVINHAMNFAGVFLEEGDNISAEVNRIKNAAEKKSQTYIESIGKESSRMNMYICVFWH